MPAWPDDEDVAYSVIVLRLTEDAPFRSTIAETLDEVCEDLDIPLCRTEETESPDDGRRIRIAIQGDETDAVVLVQTLADETDWFVTSATKVMTTNHPDEFDCSERWPEEALADAMEQIGMVRHQLTCALPGWFPFTMFGSFVQDSVSGVLTKHGLSADEVAGIGMDKTTPGFPTVHLWCSPGALEVVLLEDVDALVQECVEYVADDPLVRRWLERTVKDAGHLC